MTEQAPPGLGMLGDETTQTCAVARQLAHNVGMLYEMADHCKNGPEAERYAEGIEATMNRICHGLDELDTLLRARNQINHLRKLYPRDGVEFGGRWQSCYADHAGRIAGWVWFQISLITRTNKNENGKIVGPALDEISSPLPDGEPIPRIDIQMAVNRWSNIRDSLSVTQPNMQRLEVLLQSESHDVAEMVRKATTVVYSKPRRPTDWIKLIQQLTGEKISDSTWRNRIVDGTYRKSPTGNKMNVSLDLTCLPSAYSDDLEA